MSVTIYVGNRSPSLTYTVKSDGTAVDLVALGVSSSAFSMREIDSATKKVDAEASSFLTDGTDGKLVYAWAADDVDTAGSYMGWFTLSLSSGKTQDTPEFEVEVSAHGPGAGDLCTLADVRNYIDKPTGDRHQDDLLHDLIRAASVAIPRYCGRQFALDTSSSTRTFDLGRVWDRPRVRIDDLSAVPSAVAIIDANGDAVGSLTVSGASQDIEFYPLNRDTALEPITHIGLRPRATTRLYPDRFLTVTGIWGWPSIPDDVRLAAIQQVREWWRRDNVVASDTFAEELVLSPASTRSLGQGVKRMLTSYRRATLR